MLLKPQSLYLFTSEAKTERITQGEVAYAVTFILMTNRCNGQRTGSCKMQLLRNKMNAGEKNKDMCDSPKIRCLGQLYKARFHCLICKLSYFYLGILYFSSEMEML